MRNLEDFTVRDYGTEGLPTDSETTGCSLPQYCVKFEELVQYGAYVLNITGCNRNSHTKLACSLSNNETTVFDLNNNGLQKLTALKGSRETVTCIRFAPQKDNQLYTSSLDGLLQLSDLRTGSHQVQTFQDPKKRPISCFDVSCDGRFVVAGTEVSGGDALLLFWDVRTNKLLGGYWDSHIEDVTQVVFHPNKPNYLMTGAMDGLINLFDINQRCEDDALLTSLNTESTVEKLGWIEKRNGDIVISCLTHPAELQLWKESDCVPYSQFSRQSIATALNIKSPDNLYSVNVHHHKATDNIVLLAGSTMGKGDCFRSLVVKDNLQSVSQFMGNGQIVRASWYNAKDDILVSGGEKGTINVWKAQEDNDKHTPVSNITTKLKGHRIKPY